MVDHHVDRRQVEAQQWVQPSLTNRSSGLSSPSPSIQINPPCTAALPCTARSSKTKTPQKHTPYTLHHNTGMTRPGGHSEGPNTRSLPELGRETPPRQWYCVSRRGRVGRRQALPCRNTKTTQRQTTPLQISKTNTNTPQSHQRGVEQPGSSSGS